MSSVVVFLYMQTMKPCGHRLEDRHFVIIRNKARKWKVKEAVALRKIIDDSQ